MVDKNLVNQLKTWKGVDIPIETRAIFYVCSYNYENKTIAVEQEVLRNSTMAGINLYANVRNPESQLATGKTFNELIINLNILHANLRDPKWVKDLANYM